MCNVKYAVNRISCFSISVECSYFTIFNSESNGIFYLSCRINRCDIRYNLVYRVTLVPPNTEKIEALRSCGALNRHPEKVRDPLFAEHDFFDPHDLVQLKYETIRAVEIDRRPIAHAALDFGLSRPTIYEAQENFRQKGIKGLLPQKRGPKKPRKLTPEVHTYLQELAASEPDLKAAALVQRVRRRFSVFLHPRTVEKALRKKGPQAP
jgi:transposase